MSCAAGAADRVSIGADATGRVGAFDFDEVAENDAGGAEEVFPPPSGAAHAGGTRPASCHLGGDWVAQVVELCQIVKRGLHLYLWFIGD